MSDNLELFRQPDPVASDLDVIRRDAIFSPCRTWRYSLTRTWKSLSESPNRLVVVGLNPSTADETRDDPTIRRCMHFARAWGHDGLFMLNLFAFRSTDPKGLEATPDPVGPENDLHLASFTRGRRVLCAWGAGGSLFGRAAVVWKGLATHGRDLVCLGLTSDGQPIHPMARGRHRVPDDTKATALEWRGEA